MKKNNVKFLKVRRPDGEVFEIMEKHVHSHLNRGYELVSEEPIVRDINTSTNDVQSKEDDKADKEPSKDEVQEDEAEEDDTDSKPIEEMGYKELQSFVSANTDNYKVIGKKTEVLQEKAREIRE